MSRNESYVQQFLTNGGAGQPWPPECVLRRTAEKPARRGDLVTVKNKTYRVDDVNTELLTMSCGVANYGQNVWVSPEETHE